MALISEPKLIQKATPPGRSTLVEDDKIHGLGSGSPRRAPSASSVNPWRRASIIGIPMSRADGARACRWDSAFTIAEHHHIDVTIDGADEVISAGSNLLKGRGGALLREKIIAQRQ